MSGALQADPPNGVEASQANAPNGVEASQANAPNGVEASQANAPNGVEASQANAPNGVEASQANAPNGVEASQANVPNGVEASQANAPNGVDAPNGVGRGVLKHLGLTVGEVEAKEGRTENNWNANEWQPFDEVKNVVWIKQNTVYSVALEDWEQKVKIFAERVDRMEKRSGDLKNEIYQLVGFFSVFQGVVLTAVTQMTQSPDTQTVCKKVWSPIILTGLAWIVTIIGVWQKLTGIHSLDQRCSDEDSSRREAVKWARQLRRRGEDFKFSKNMKQIKLVPKPDPHWITRWVNKWLTRRVGYSDAFWTHRVIPIVAALSLFTGIFIASYFLIMCNRGLAPIHA